MQCYNASRKHKLSCDEGAIVKKRNSWLLSLAFILALPITACLGAKDKPDISIAEAWGRPSPTSAMTAAFYMVIRNTGAPDRLVSAQSEACGMAEIHESSMSSDGVMSMRHLENGIDIPAGGEVALEPGGLHVMCIEKKADFSEGEKIDLTLYFEKSGSKKIEVEIREP